MDFGKLVLIALVVAGFVYALIRLAGAKPPF